MSKRSYMEAVIKGLRSISEVDVEFVAATDSEKLHNSCDGVGRKKIYVRLLLSIDRRETTESAMETVSCCKTTLKAFKITKSIKTLSFFLFKVKLALEMRNVGVVGIDLSGNPLVGEW